MKYHRDWAIEAPSLRTDVYKLGERARQLIKAGAVKRGGAANSETVACLLNEALAIEIAFVVRFEPQYLFAYAERIAARILELGGTPNYCPAVLLEHAGYRRSVLLRKMAEEDLAAERMAMPLYLEMLAYIGDAYPAVRDTLEQVHARHKAHVEELMALLSVLNVREPPPHRLALPRFAGATLTRPDSIAVSPSYGLLLDT